MSVHAVEIYLENVSFQRLRIKSQLWWFGFFSLTIAVVNRVNKETKEKMQYTLNRTFDTLSL